MFVVGLATAFWWCGAQAHRALTTTQGVSLAQYIAFCSGFIVQLVLAIEARRKNTGRIISQQVSLFATWSLCSLALIAVVINRGGYVWSRGDTTIAELASAGVVATIVWALFTRKPMSDAAVRAWVNISLKSLPQFLMIMKIWSEGSSGITTAAIVLGETSILMRLIPLSVSMKTEGVNRDKKWLWTSDAVNLASWSAVTVAWFVN
jgi:hypothetical protein